MNIDELKANKIGIQTIYSHEYNGTELSSLESSKIYPMVLSLSVYNTKITSLKGIENFPNLQILDITNVDLSSFGLKGIENCKKIQKIFCTGSKLSTLEGIEDLSDLDLIAYSDNLLPDEILEFNNSGDPFHKVVNELKYYYKTITRKRKIKNILERNIIS